MPTLSGNEIFKKKIIISGMTTRPREKKIKYVNNKEPNLEKTKQTRNKRKNFRRPLNNTTL